MYVGKVFCSLNTLEQVQSTKYSDALCPSGVKKTQRPVIKVKEPQMVRGLLHPTSVTCRV